MPDPDTESENADRDGWAQEIADDRHPAGCGGAPSPAEQERMVEAVLFASAEPVGMAELARRMPEGCDLAGALDSLVRHYDRRGVRLVRVGEAWAFRTAPDLGHLMKTERIETRKLSRAATETLAIIAYHQPVTRAEIEEIRGVSISPSTLEQLLDLGWIRFGRRRMTAGRPATLVVTEAFLDHFGLESARDLPGLAELRAAGLLDTRSCPDQAQPGPAPGADHEGIEAVEEGAEPYDTRDADADSVSDP